MRQNYRTATAAEVRKHYKDDGYEVRIDAEGHVTYRSRESGPWLEGRWVSEYRRYPADGDNPAYVALR